MTRRRGLVVGGALAVWAAGLVAYFVLVVRYDLDFFGLIAAPWLLAFGAFAVTGAIVAWHRPGHVIGLLFLLHGLTAPVSYSVIALALGPFADHSMAVRTLIVAAAVAWNTAMSPLLALVLILFPDGRLPSRRWRWVLVATPVAMILGATAAFSAGGWYGDAEQVLLEPPFGGRLTGVAEVLSVPLPMLILLLSAAAGWSLIVRYRRSDAVARQQIKWLALAALLVTLIVAGLIITEGALRVPQGAVMLGLAAAIALVPVSAAVAILRYRLYDVDVVLNRAIVFALLAVFITGLYAAVVVGVGALVGDRSNLLLTVGTVALIAVVFEPVRARVQHWANVAVYGRRATPYEVLAAIADEMESATAADGQLAALAGLLADGTGATHATVWVHDEGVLRAAACWPVHDPGDHPGVAVSGGVDAIADRAHAEAVRADGALLGALSFDRGRNDPVTPRDRALLAQMAGQASLVLANARLRARLQARLVELRASRQRLVAAQDEARRKLERDLHDGAQQQLVALKVKLGLARRMAAKEDAGADIDELLQSLSSAADEAVDALRSLARGIYPPLLEAEGLERAITTQTDKLALPVTVHARGLRRYGRQIEATVYFCVLEALSNALKHAQATAIHVTVGERDGQLTFSITDDGVGFDPHNRGLGLTNMADRIDALDGALTIHPTPDHGAHITGAIPIPPHTTTERATVGVDPREAAAQEGVVPA